MLTKLSHIELLVKNLDETTKIYDKLFGLKPSSPTMNLTHGGVKARKLGSHYSLMSLGGTYAPPCPIVEMNSGKREDSTRL